MTWESSDLSLDLRSMEEGASAGCSVCARELVNGRELSVLLAEGLLTSPRPPRDAPPSLSEPFEKKGLALPERLRRSLAERRSKGSLRAPDRNVGALPPSAVPRVLDPSAVVAHKHIGLAIEAERTQEIDELEATVERPNESSRRMLAALAGYFDFDLYFVSIVRKERATYRVQRGLDDTMAAFRELRREMSYCTHCVSAGLPFIVENALAEPFFRGNRAATRFGIAAYVGVPLRTSKGILVGTLCALSTRPRLISAESVAVLSVFGRWAIAEIERERSPGLLASVLEASSQHADILTERFFQKLLCADVARNKAPRDLEAQPRFSNLANASKKEALSALIVMQTGSIESALSVLREGEAAGRIGPDTFGILLPNAGESGGQKRITEILEIAKTHGLALAHVGAAVACESPEQWVSAAMIPSPSASRLKAVTNFE